MRSDVPVFTSNVISFSFFCLLSDLFLFQNFFGAISFFFAGAPPRPWPLVRSVRSAGWDSDVGAGSVGSAPLWELCSAP